MGRIVEIENQIKTLQAELSFEYETERMREAEAERNRLVREKVDLARQDAESKAALEASYERDIQKRKALESREALQRHEKLRHLFSILPGPEQMPLSKCCHRPLIWPRDDFPFAPHTVLVCPGCGSTQAASFDSPYFPRRYD